MTLKISQFPVYKNFRLSCARHRSFHRRSADRPEVALGASFYKNISVQTQRNETQIDQNLQKSLYNIIGVSLRASGNNSICSY